MTFSDLPSSYRLELTLRKPILRWFSKPTVIVHGRGQPAQWGKGTWQVDSADGSVISVYLFNRLWTFGRAEFRLDSDAERPLSVTYRAPVLPFLRGTMTAD